MHVPWAELSWVVKVRGTFTPGCNVPLRTAISKCNIPLSSKADRAVYRNPINDTAVQKMAHKEFKKVENELIPSSSTILTVAMVGFGIRRALS